MSWRSVKGDKQYSCKMTLSPFSFPCSGCLCRTWARAGQLAVAQQPEQPLELVCVGRAAAGATGSATALCPPSTCTHQPVLHKDRKNVWSKLFQGVLLASSNLWLGNFLRQKAGLWSLICIFYSCIWCHEFEVVMWTHVNFEHPVKKSSRLWVYYAKRCLFQLLLNS